MRSLDRGQSVGLREAAKGSKYKAGRTARVRGPNQGLSSQKEGVMTNLVTFDPFAETGMDEWFRGFFKPMRLEGTREPITIKMDLTEMKDGYMVHAELPGVKKENINVEIEGNEVTITAEVKRECEKKEGDKMLRSERYYGNVYRSFTLPHELDEAKCIAKFDNGVLELKLVNKPGVMGRKLPVL
jgi:HSP20 family protein